MSLLKTFGVMHEIDSWYAMMLGNDMILSGVVTVNAPSIIFQRETRQKGIKSGCIYRPSEMGKNEKKLAQFGVTHLLKFILH